MDYRRTSQTSRTDALKARARKARGWARLTALALCCVVATAVWQERALAPQAHDRMQQAMVLATDWLEQSESAQSYLTAMANFSGGANEGEFDPITEKLLELRQ